MNGGARDREIRWKIHLKSSPPAVFDLLATDEGRRRFWAETARETGGVIEFRFFNGQSWRSRVVDRDRPRRFALHYVSGSLAVFELHEDVAGGTELTLTEAGVPEPDWRENRAGWVAVLLQLKAAADFSIDLRNRHPDRGWEKGFVDV